MTYEIITVSSKIPTAPYYSYHQFIASLKKYGYSPTILGTIPDQYIGLGSKPRLLLKHLKERENKTPYIIATDAWDVVFMASPDEVMERFKEFNSPFVCNSEQNCFPHTYKEQFDALSPPTKYAYLNSGFIVAETDALIAVLESMNFHVIPEDYKDEKGTWWCSNDQEWYMKEFFKQPVKMVMDYQQYLCQTLHNAKEEEFDFIGERIKNVLTGTYPLIAHMNGSGKNVPFKNIFFNKAGV